MLIEPWEILRGYDRWIDVEAKIVSSDVRRTAHHGHDGSVSYSYDAGDQLTWTDAQGNTQFADFQVDDQSSLYQFVGGESIAIRYNPRDPSRFYSRDLLRSRVHFISRCIVTGLALLSLLGLPLIFSYAFGRR